jgi:hypothetical protein
MTQDITNPYQEQHPEELDLGQAIRVIAERTAFRSEAEQRLVLAAIDKANNDEQADASEDDDEPDDEQGANSGEQAGTGERPTSPTPAKTTPAKATPARVGNKR